MGSGDNESENDKESLNDLKPDNFEGYTKPNGATRLSRDGWRTFVPANLPPVIGYNREMVLLLAEAERTMGELKGKGASLENPHILLRAYLKREAVVSSKIEGTLASLEDLNRYEILGIGKAYAEELSLQEVVNHVAALEWALKEIEGADREIDLDIIQHSHKILMRGVRGQERNPGEFRDRQNYIVRSGVRVSRIIYTPPPPEVLPELLRNFERFCMSVHRDIPVLIQCALIHYQFEAIHPFGDGNGRIGRLLILLMLSKRGLLPKPLIYLSAFFDKNLAEYYHGLLNVSRKSRWSAWVKFFLRAFVAQSVDAIKTIEKLEGLRVKYRSTLHDLNASGNAITLMEVLFENPYVSVPLVRKRLNITYPTAKGAVTTLVNAGILVQTDIPHKSKIFVAPEIERHL